MWAVGHNHCIACTCGMSTVAINIYSALLYTVSVTANDRRDVNCEKPSQKTGKIKVAISLVNFQSTLFNGQPSEFCKNFPTCLFPSFNDPALRVPQRARRARLPSPRVAASALRDVLQPKRRVAAVALQRAQPSTAGARRANWLATISAIGRRLCTIKHSTA